MPTPDFAQIEKEAVAGNYKPLRRLSRAERVAFIEDLESWNSTRALAMAMAKLIISGEINAAKS
ncbi:hypothetical protein FKG94_03280 [Exilibacterium tricleocarpae]|uniref:Uncharacterized protein n=1 Tax=Exilibacterium tricleocarpae TaxID=2591008 RepID=A0A545U6Y7_9GAMM|nr:hypothetical protein [Exilibacterium tricleocarpae]TQV85226.1 hypothetical protein FKG94_03280 [Exilibacterium tricleocarpae]